MNNGLVLLFNGISIFSGYAMPNHSFYKDISGTIEPIAERIRSLIPFQGYLSESERNSVIVVRTRLLRIRSPAL